MIENVKQTSVFRLLDEQFMLQGSGNDSNLLKNLNTMLSGSKSFKRPDRLGSLGFIICHYAGDVEYEITNFVEKNKDSVSASIVEALSTSRN